MHALVMYDNRIFVKTASTNTVMAGSQQGHYDFCMAQKLQPKSVVSQWLNRGLEKPGKTNVGLARALGLDQPRISEMRNGKRRVQTGELRIIAEYLEEPIPDELIPAGTVVQHVPIVSWVSAGRMASNGDPDDVLGHISTAGLSPRGRWIALKVQGVSMDRISPPDSVIVVNVKDRDLVPQACYIIADSEGRASYKRYRPQSGSFRAGFDRYKPGDDLPQCRHTGDRPGATINSGHVNMREYSAKVVGIGYEGRWAYIKANVRPGDGLDLEAEPENPYDPRAVAVYHRGRKIGYIPADRKWIWHCLSEGDSIGGVAEELVLNEDGEPAALSMTVTIYSDGPGYSDRDLAPAYHAPTPLAQPKNVKLPRQRSGKSIANLLLVASFVIGLGAIGGRPWEKAPQATVTKISDRMPAPAAPASPQDVAPPFGNWTENRSTSKISNRESVFYSLDASERTPDSIGVLHYPVMRVTCLENETRVLFDFNRYMGSDPLSVAWRADGGKLRTQTMPVSEKGDAFGYWNGRGIPMLKDLNGKEELVIAAAPWGQSPVEVTFNLDGIDAVVASVRASCAW